MESSTRTEWGKGWLGEGGLRWWVFYSSKNICASEGHLSYFSICGTVIFIIT